MPIGDSANLKTFLLFCSPTFSLVVASLLTSCAPPWLSLYPLKPVEETCFEELDLTHLYTFTFFKRVSTTKKKVMAYWGPNHFIIMCWSFLALCLQAPWVSWPVLVAPQCPLGDWYCKFSWRFWLRKRGLMPLKTANAHRNGVPAQVPRAGD